MIPFTPPEYRKTAFNCPFCGAYAKQYWQPSGSISEYEEFDYRYIQFSTCSHCNTVAIWRQSEGTWRLTDPCFGAEPIPNSDLPPNVLADYEEARSIASLSPRGAAALLRLVLQKLCMHLGGNGRNINDDIKKLVEDGLPVRIQQALDIVRVVGNNAVHPGELDVEDSPEIVAKLFSLVNLIADTMITQQKEIEDLYRNLPEGALEAIERRDGD